MSDDLETMTLVNIVDGEPGDEPWFCFLKCDFGHSRTEDLDDTDWSDECEICGQKMRVIRTYPAGDY